MGRRTIWGFSGNVEMGREPRRYSVRALEMGRVQRAERANVLDNMLNMTVICKSNGLLLTWLNCSQSSDFELLR